MSASLTVSFQMSVEVERKFLCTDEVLQTLEKIGVCVGQRQFHDQYFDTSTFSLTLRDVWLRKRKGCWELKCPVNGEGAEAEASLCSRYREITNLSDIQRRVKELMGNQLQVSTDGGRTLHRTPEEQCLAEDESWLKELNLECFAAFTTLRRSFTTDESGVQIDVDQADFGYSVGEIEVIVPDGGDVQSALEKIKKTAERLGVTGGERVAGKMNVYLKTHRPQHYEQLLQEHVL